MISSTFSQKTVWQVEVIHVVLSAEVSKLSHSVIKKPIDMSSINITPVDTMC